MVGEAEWKDFRLAHAKHMVSDWVGSDHMAICDHENHPVSSVAFTWWLPSVMGPGYPRVGHGLCLPDKSWHQGSGNLWTKVTSKAAPRWFFSAHHPSRSPKPSWETHRIFPHPSSQSCYPCSADTKHQRTLNPKVLIKPVSCLPLPSWKIYSLMLTVANCWSD